MGGQQWNFVSKDPAIFPEANYSAFSGLSPTGLYDLFIASELLAEVAKLLNQYTMSKFRISSNISGKEINIFLGYFLCSESTIHLPTTSCTGVYLRIVKTGW